MKKSILLVPAFAFLSIISLAQTVTDYDGNVYNTVTIGTQVWTKENLKVTHYGNGDDIPNVIDNSTWNNAATGAYCYYDNSALNGSIWGGLYNWYAVNDNRNIAPAGWHIPSDAEWNILEKYLDNTVDTAVTGWTGTDIGGQLKFAGTEYWTSPNTGATNSSGFSALPGGGRGYGGAFSGLRASGYWWTTSATVTGGWKRNLGYSSPQIYRYEDYKKYGYSVRCIQNAASGVNDNHAKDRIRFYPNPVTDRIYLTASENHDVHVQVFNMMGKCVLQCALTNGTKVLEISSLPVGIYVIKFTGTDWTEERKMIKE